MSNFDPVHHSSEYNNLYDSLLQFSSDPSYRRALQRFNDYKLEEIKKLDQVTADYSRTIDALVNLVFKVRYDKESNEYYYPLFEGKLAHEIGLTTRYVANKSLKELFGHNQSLFYASQYERAFSGESLSYKHRYKGRFFYTTLSPISEKGEVTEIIGSTVEITMYEKAETTIRHMAYHDPLTDLPNLRKLHADLENLIENSSEHHPVTVMYCDLDRFKNVNDALGYVTGDQVIQKIAERLKDCLEPNIELYRLTGDEFIFIIQGELSLSRIMEFGHKILERARPPIYLKEKEIFLTLSIGVSTSGKGSQTSQKILGQADIAKQYCKVRGRDHVLLYSDDMNKSYNHLLSLESSLRKAILNNELTLHYQPKVDVRTGGINGIEALVRWNHAENGWISPGEFIPLAEEAGMISQIDEWVMGEACRQTKEWLKQGFAAERVAVNVSATEIQQENYSNKVKKVLEQNNLPSSYLEIEVTENSVMQNSTECIRTMQELKSMGVTLSIDDFGTGYSSLSYLRQFPIHNLKIDQTFIKSVKTGPSDAEIVKAIIQMADAFKLGVVAEGVECENVLTFLRENQCESYQGYYFSKPLPPNEIREFLSKSSKYRHNKNPNLQ
ncbi:bifunctional diguanylate cyclase/phosphodiesterase [Halobacillus sp. A1]|uniref:putative bifunctional diguanylate cyclase/phosphodiesterase n=1 Tax=Halobacillus sp. A1 TaxID=2880262 RepID=UPI0020A6470D|nr:bifunctional diguanylate cyclase/phosphodiesterase [Halobacillus sp. A1]MCP3030175.1 bifunctional diguanylate cyclase/phosphodiesterase [Halobacillus sp. A1]